MKQKKKSWIKNQNCKSYFDGPGIDFYLLSLMSEKTLFEIQNNQFSFYFAIEYNIYLASAYIDVGILK